MSAMLCASITRDAAPLWKMIEWINVTLPGAYFDCVYEDGRPELYVYQMMANQEISLGRVETLCSKARRP